MLTFMIPLLQQKPLLVKNSKKEEIEERELWTISHRYVDVFGL